MTSDGKHIPAVEKAFIVFTQKKEGILVGLSVTAKVSKIADCLIRLFFFYIQLIKKVGDVFVCILYL